MFVEKTLKSQKLEMEILLGENSEKIDKLFLHTSIVWSNDRRTIQFYGELLPGILPLPHSL